MKKESMPALISRYRGEIMGFAALWVFFFHEWRSVFGDSVIGEAERFVVGMGFYGVDFFLFLSGMGLVYAIGKHSLGEFYKRRYVRILVPYVLTAMASWVMKSWEFDFFLKTLIGYNFWMVDMYTMLWFVNAIAVLYLVFPLYWHFFQRSSHKYVFTGAALLIWYLTSIALDGVMRADLYGFTNRIPVFLVGILAGWMSKEKTLVFTWKAWIICFLGLAAGVVCSYLTRYRGTFILVPSSNCCVPNFLVTVSGVCILAQLLSLLNSYGKKAGETVRKILLFYGVMSLEFYCIQELFPKMVQQALEGRCGDLLINLASFAVMTLAAYGMHKLCELVYKLLRK